MIRSIRKAFLVANYSLWGYIFRTNWVKINLADKNTKDKATAMTDFEIVTDNIYWTYNTAYPIHRGLFSHFKVDSEKSNGQSTYLGLVTNTINLTNTHK